MDFNLKRSTPEFVTEPLMQLLQEWKIKDVILLQRGETLWSWHDGGADRVSAVYSCTKSILSALIGIAIDQGLIGSIKERIRDYFPSLNAASDERYRMITIEHLLTMTSGIDWPEFDKPYWQMKRTDDWIGFVLRQEVVHEPGHAFAYNTGGSQLLSAILTKAAGMSTLDFAQRTLFGKLGFHKPKWDSHGGIYEGGAGLYLTARDMASFGQLYLQGGVWEGEQVISEAWVEASTTAQHKGLSHYDPPIFGEYGYHWWVSSQSHNGHIDCYFAKGYGGQYIVVMPSLELVAAIRKEPEGRANAIYSKKLLLEHILPFCSSSVQK
ncbi:serine hydrolase [Paenibacillus sp. R14(2021)]|uniref:serine hydrolase domain-containing protein n=1 Tax=Paenibacillus sp. R14(2021) TaxID=2859228 RepID=UPI001C6136C8|nr:serine hydrolase [Paenibacillus sp. R14(2021)]